MLRMNHVYRRAACAALAVAAMSVAGCSLDKQEMPALSGPSEFGLSLTMTASPDQLPRNGTSQSLVTITVRDAQSRAVAGQRIALSLPVNSPQGAGLSQSEVVTNGAGQATFTVTAPASGSIGNIQVSATPIGTNADNATPRVISIIATPQNGTAPTAAFTFTPAAPEVGQLVTFNASTTTDEGVACGTCTFTWNFGGDGTATGRIATHVFSAGGSYVVTMTATDVGGITATAQQTVTVTAATIPTSVSVTSSPNPPVAKQTATFTVSATAAANHRIVSYEFIWGDGSNNSSGSPVIQHTYSQSGPVLLTVTVRDDLGQSTTINSVINVSSGLTATFTTTISGNDVTFDASASSSSSASTITEYAWDFESDGTYDDTKTSPIITKTLASGTHRVTLKITDNRGTTQTFAATVIVP